jgi:hypothetical protein
MRTAGISLGPTDCSSGILHKAKGDHLDSSPIGSEGTQDDKGSRATLTQAKDKGNYQA